VHKLWTAITAVMASWHQGKLFIEHAVTISHDSLHIIVGVVAWLLIALVLRRPITAWRPWLWLFALILWNEAVDLWTEQWPDPGQQYGEGAKDLLLTMTVPTLLLFAARYQPHLFRSGRVR
jgi:hypothetical protein